MNSTPNIETKKKPRNKKLSWKLLISFLAFEIIFTGITAPLLVFYGPFENVKTTIVGAAMTTLSHQYIAKIFLSEEKINAILNKDSVEEVEQVKQDDIKLPKKHDSSIERYDISGKKFKGHILVINDPTRVKVGYTKKMKREGQLTSQIAKDNDAIAAVNGGGFTDTSSDGKWTGTGGTPTGLIMSQGEVVFSDLANNNEKREMMALTKEGRLLVGKYSVNELMELKTTEAISFGPPLVINGQPTIKNGDGGWGIAPRTAIGQRKDGAILLLVIDGRQPLYSVGASLKEVQDVLIQYGAYNATNLDGGSSTTMYYEGEIVNRPSDSLGERSVASVVYVK